jgi:hypothetical protein
VRFRNPYLLAVAGVVALGYLAGGWVAGAVAFWAFLWGFEELLGRPQPACAGLPENRQA